MSRYSKLTRFLESHDSETVSLSFDDLNEIVRIPPSARAYSAWWANNVDSRPHSKSWLSAGRVARPDFQAACVTFTKRRFPIKPEPLDRGQPDSAPTTTARLPRSQTGDALPQPAPPSADPTTIAIEIQCEWRSVGEVLLAEGKLKFPSLPTHAGLYRFELHAADRTLDSIYVGEAKNLRSRTNGYRNPAPEGQGQVTNRRMNARMLSHLRSNGRINLAIVQTVRVGGCAADLDIKFNRLLGENATIFEIHRLGHRILNL